MSLPKLSVRTFRATLSSITEPVSVNGGTWFPKEWSWTDIQDTAIREHDEMMRAGEFSPKRPRAGESSPKAPSTGQPNEPPERDPAEGEDVERERESGGPTIARSQPLAQDKIRAMQQAQRDEVLRRVNRGTKRAT